MQSFYSEIKAFYVTVRSELGDKSIQYFVDHGEDLDFIPGEIRSC